MDYAVFVRYQARAYDWRYTIKGSALPLSEVEAIVRANHPHALQVGVFEVLDIELKEAA